MSLACCELYATGFQKKLQKHEEAGSEEQERQLWGAKGEFWKSDPPAGPVKSHGMDSHTRLELSTTLWCIRNGGEHDSLWGLMCTRCATPVIR